MLISPDQSRTDNTRIQAIRPLIAPALLQEQLPASEAVLARVEQSRNAICDVLHGRDDRLLVVVGPCSIHDHDQAMEYAHWLQSQSERLGEDLCLVMRC
ncbi:MAG: 3-deoxy-7-phosphoheptulonate synthase, partial [Alphaproteobacteria bacterium]|nr:3-deoxy-7-phosphoheptulonate synthase [Alphaproteobacteria bacterium]